MSRKVTETLPTIEEIAAQIKNKKPVDEKPAGQPKEPGDTDTTEVDPEAGVKPLDHMGPGAEEVPDVTDPVEAAAEGVVEKPIPVEKPKDPQAAKFAALARREKAARDQHAEIERRRAEIEAKAKEIEEHEARVRSAKRPSDVLKAHGLTYQQVTEDILGIAKEPEKDPVDAKLDERFTPVSSELETLKKEMAEIKQYAAQLEQERVATIQRQIDDQIVDAAKQNNCEYLLAAGDEGVQVTRAYIQEYYKSTKKILSYAEACDKIEEYYTTRLDKFYGTEKAKTKFAPTPAVPSTQKPQVSQAKERPSTLTNSLNQGPRATADIDKLPKHEALALLTPRLKYTS